MSNKKKNATLSRDEEIIGAEMFGKHVSAEKRRALLVVTLAACALPVLLGLRLWDQIPEVVASGLIGTDGKDDSMPRWMVVLGLPAFMCLMDVIAHGQLHINQKRMTIPSPAVRLVGRWGFPILSVIFCSGMILQSAGQEALQMTFVTPCALGILLLLLGSHMFDCPEDSKLALRISGLEGNPPLWKAVHRFAGWTWMLVGLLIIAGAMVTGSSTILTAVLVLAALAAPWVYARGRLSRLN